MENPLRIQYFVGHAQEGLYLTVPFNMPPDTESITLTYHYERHRETKAADGSFIQRSEINIIDLGLIAPDGTQVGASGSDKSSISVSATTATPGYRPNPLNPGEWKILAGAYKVAPEGVTITYEISFTSKTMRLLKGDLHVHTLASDGILTVDELAQRATRHGLDFLAITDHNQFVSSDFLPQLPGLTLIPGVEWTHFKGHANFLGLDRPYDEPFFANTPQEIQARFDSAHERGALITINHPCDDVCPFQFDMNSLPFDCLEIWNGPMRMSNLMAVGLWHSMLMDGKKVPICGGSDYHRDHLFIMPGGPTTCVYAQSASPADILSALRQGHAYLTFAPDGPSLCMKAGDAILGDSILFSETRNLELSVDGLQSGDVLQVVTPKGSTPLLKAEGNGRFDGEFFMDEPGFARIEILRAFIPGMPLLPALLSNPIYFE
ncbi:MAG: CehA/McbA family metallohydrolase [Anaerolineales bacterium]